MEQITLRQEMRQYMPTEQNLEIEDIECLYNMVVNSNIPEEVDFAKKSLVAAMLSAFNTAKYSYNNKVNTSVVSPEDLDICISITTLRSIEAYKKGQDEEHKKGDNFLRYCMGAIRQELKKEYKVSLPFYEPHTTKERKKEMLSRNKGQKIKKDENGLDMHDEEGNPIYLFRRKVIHRRTGKVNVTLDGKEIPFKEAAKMPDELFQMEEVYDDTNYFGAKIITISPNESEESVISNSLDKEITESSSINNSNSILNPGHWETSIMNEDLREKIRAMENGDVVLYRFGIDRGYPRTVAETARDLNVTPKFINYWVEKVTKKFAETYPDYYYDYFSA